MLGNRSGVIFRYATTPNTMIPSTVTKTVNGFFTLKPAMLPLPLPSVKGVKLQYGASVPSHAVICKRKDG